MARAAPAASRAAAIISFLTAHPSRGFTISELVQHLGMNIASAHATLAVLCDAGFLLRDPVHRTYVLGPALAATGSAALEQHPAVAAAVEQAEVLAAELHAEVGVSALAGRDLIFLSRRGPEPLASSIGYPGDRVPLLAPFGAVFVAWSEEAAVSEWIDRAGATPAVAERYRRVLEEVRALGFSVPMPSIVSAAITDSMERLRMGPTAEAEHDLTDALQRVGADMILLLKDLSPADEVMFKTVAAPIFDPIGRVLLSMSITGPERAVTVEEVIRLGQRLVQSASIATRQGRGRTPKVGSARDAAG